ncbi:MAG: DUF4382 domain-containing protein, partial [Planctomycetota bacterium]
MRHTARLTLAFLLLSMVPACSGGGSASATGGTGFLTLEATDKPFDHSLVVEARLGIDLVRIHREGGDGFQTLYEGPPLQFDLLDLQNGVVRTLVAFAPLTAGRYRQLRLHVSSGHLELTNGNVYTTGDGSLELTSQDTSGFKVFIDPPLIVADQISYKLLLDFDLTKTFKPVPGNDPENATKFHLHPVIRVANLGLSGTLSGTVVADDGSGNLLGVDMATVYV